jgi:hypothetical protein
MANSQPFPQEFALRAFPHPRRAQQNQAQRAKELYGDWRAVRWSTFQPFGAIYSALYGHSLSRQRRQDPQSGISLAQGHFEFKPLENSSGKSQDESQNSMRI